MANPGSNVAPLSHGISIDAVGYSPSGTPTVTGSFAAPGQSASFLPLAGRPFNISLWGSFTGSVQLERSFDGTNWLPVTAGGVQVCKYTAACSESFTENETVPVYRLNATALSVGSASYRLSQ